MDLDLYLEFIGLSEHKERLRVADYQALCQILAAHTSHVIYQNVDIHISRLDRRSEPLSLDIHGLQTKLLIERRGGMCYEISELLFHALITLGFHVRRCAVYPLNDLPFNPTAPFSHNVLIVSIGPQQFLVDPSYGYNSLRYPLEIKRATEDHTYYDFSEPKEKYKIEHEEACLILYLWIKERWASLYRIPLPYCINDSSQELSEMNRLMMMHEFPVAIRQKLIKIGKLTARGRIGFHLDLPLLTGFVVEYIDGNVATKKEYDLRVIGETDTVIADLHMLLPSLSEITATSLRYIIERSKEAYCGFSS